MKFSGFLFLIFFSLSVFAITEEESREHQISECRRQRQHPGRMYIEDVERCQNLLLRDSLERFNKFADQRAPAVDCPEARHAPALVSACRSAGVRKVKLQATSFGVSIQDKDIYACEVDNSHWVFSNYVWFCADTPRGKISQMTQKPLGGDCF